MSDCELPAFERHRAEYLDDDGFAALQRELMRNPTAGEVHQTLRVTPAMEAGRTDHVWSLEEIASLVDFQDLQEMAA